MDREEAFLKIKEYFSNLDEGKDELEGELVYDTEKGVFGTSNIDVVYTWLSELNLSNDTKFVDLGSGDGRVTFIASLFCDTTGIEFEPSLIKKSQRHKEKLGSTAKIIQGDYEEMDFSDVDILFCYADHEFSDEFIDKLKKQFAGKLYVYQGVFFPKRATKNRTTWIGQTPILCYTFLPDAPAMLE